jgi:transcriptional regulator with XRE-family HTH domain
LQNTKLILGTLLKQQRLKSGLTLNELAEKMGTDRQYIWNIENGKINMSLDYLDKLLRELNTKPTDFFKYIDSTILPRA